MDSSKHGGLPKGNDITDMWLTLWNPGVVNEYPHPQSIQKWCYLYANYLIYIHTTFIDMQIF